MKILVGIDGSAGSLDAVREVAKLVCEDDEVVLVHVMPTPYVEGLVGTPGEAQGEIPDRPGFPGQEDVWDGMAAQFEGQRGPDVFKEAVAILKEKGIVPRLVVREGDPAYELVQMAQEEDVDLIALGHRGLSAIEAFLLGSVSHRVVLHAPCSVLVVRAKEER